MSAAQLIGWLRSVGVGIGLSEGRLRVTAERGTVTPALRQEIAAEKTALIALLECRSGRGAGRPGCCGAARRGAAAVGVPTTAVGDRPAGAGPHGVQPRDGLVASPRHGCSLRHGGDPHRGARQRNPACYLLR